MTYGRVRIVGDGNEREVWVEWDIVFGMLTLREFCGTGAAGEGNMDEFLHRTFGNVIVGVQKTIGTETVCEFRGGY